MPTFEILTKPAGLMIIQPSFLLLRNTWTRGWQRLCPGYMVAIITVPCLRNDDERPFLFSKQTSPATPRSNCNAKTGGDWADVEDRVVTAWRLFTRSCLAKPSKPPPLPMSCSCLGQKVCISGTVLGAESLELLNWSKYSQGICPQTWASYLTSTSTNRGWKRQVPYRVTEEIK